MLNTSYTTRQNAQCVLQRAQGHGRTAIQKIFLLSIVYRLHRGTQILFATKITATVVATLTGGDGKTAVGKETQKQNEGMFQADLTRSLREL